MQLRKLSVTNFRTYSNLELELSSGLTTFTADNGEGKSNLLEAIYLLAIGKSYRANFEKELISWQLENPDDYTIIAAEIERNEGLRSIRIGLKAIDGNRITKQVRIDGIPKRITDLIGVLNAVLFSAEDMDLIFGNPSGRRRYLDILLAQISKNYVTALSKYQRILLQRNALLKNIKDNIAQENELDFWDFSLAKEASILLQHRITAMEYLNAMVLEIHTQLSGTRDLSIEYVSTVVTDISVENLEKAMLKCLSSSRNQEISRGTTIIGPHRDDIRLISKGTEASKHVSRGQARLIALSLRLAESRLLSRERSESPIILLDDVFSELDQIHRNLIMDEISNYSQIIITTADEYLLGSNYTKDVTRLMLKAGVITRKGSSLYGN
ncbi:MAG: DNA replication/repair protein RecF [Chloroflexi bacterium]|nr:DNA replication/repair protein RecF [Chloroflexota bacterium]|tara:strand:- start:1951 stop:3099 length:1149 start_codon:yes stop_codon:yes gene_type:complete